MRQQLIQAAIEIVLADQSEVLTQQISHRALFISGLPSFLYRTERLSEDRLFYQHFGEPIDEGA